MNTITKNGIVTAIAICVFFIGTATGNAYVMIAVAAAALAAIAIFGGYGWRAWFVAAVGAVTAAAVAVRLDGTLRAKCVVLPKVAAIRTSDAFCSDSDGAILAEFAKLQFAQPSRQVRQPI